MHTLRSITLIAAGFALAAVLFTGLDRAQSDEDGPTGKGARHEQPSSEERAFRALVGRVKRAAQVDGPMPAFQVVFVATEAGSYLESFGGLEGDDAAILGRKLHALGDLVGAPAELEDADEEHEEEGEEGDDHHGKEGHDEDDDEHEDDEDGR
jgi:hypothetical protein